MLTPSTQFDPATGTLTGGSRVERRLSDLRGIFADTEAYERALADDDPIVYTVESIDTMSGEGDLHYGLGMIMPGQVGGEYYMTKGHLHAWRPAAEVYIGLSGEGVMLLEDEQGNGSRMLSLRPREIVYVPGHTAHRTINTGREPMSYMGVFPARAGHDYGAIADRNFRQMVAEVGGEPMLLERSEWMARRNRG